jgi:hypothetical protein
MKFVDSDGEDLKIVYDFTTSGLSDRQQTRVAIGVRATFRRAGVQRVQTFIKGSSSRATVEKPTDRVVHVRVTADEIKSKLTAKAFGSTPTIGAGNRSTVSTAAGPEGEAAKMNFLINVTAHEVGHGTGALPKYANDQFPLGTPINPVGAQPGTVMEQGVPADDLGSEIRYFSEEDAEMLRKALNDIPIE